MTELVPVKIKIRLGADGKHKFPNFNQLPSNLRGGQDWSHFFDSAGLGWHYDKLSGLGELDCGSDPACFHLNNDPDVWFGATCLPEAFVDAAVAKFPGEVVELTEAEWGLFYDNRAHVHEETEVLDTEALQGLKARLDLEADPNAPTKEPSASILALRAEMLDPDNTRRGIRKNPKRRWADHKLTLGVTIRPPRA